jgi:small-conductance mechanosensitive channel
MNFNEILSTILEWINHPLFNIGKNYISLKSVFILLALFWGFIWLSKWLERFMHRTLLYKDIDPGIKGSLERFSGYFVLLIGSLISLGSIGININSLTTLGGYLLVGISFGLQNITQNFMSGIIMLLERPIKKGDIVQVGNTSGRVLDIKARSTLILTRDDVVIIVPNSSFITEPVVNDSFSGDKLRLHINVGVSYESNVDAVTRVLMEVAGKNEKVLKSPPPTVILQEFADSSLNFSLRIWTNELWFSELLLSDLRYEIIREFRKQDISIPFPQRDLHIKTVTNDFPVSISQKKLS